MTMLWPFSYKCNSFVKLHVHGKTRGPDGPEALT